MNTSLLHEMTPLTPLDASCIPQANLEVSLIIPAKNSSQTLESTVKEAHRFLSQEYGESFEIILVPNPTPGDTQDQSLHLAEALAQQYPQVRNCPHTGPRGKGAAVRTGFSQSRGKWIFLTDADLPYDLEFFHHAAQYLRSGYDFVTGNRRLPSSHFDVPVSLLPLAYGRHRLGLAFNHLVRCLLPIETTDTQAGIKALSRRLAIEAFTRQTCPGFLFDLELFLTARGMGYWHIHLPVTLHLNSEKSTVRILRECALVAHWLTRIAFQNFRRAYGTWNSSTRKVLKGYQQASWSTRLFLSARWRLTPYRAMASRLPLQGTILDLGCGHGLFAIAAALTSPSRQIVGIDHDSDRVSLGTKAIQNFPNVRLEAGNMARPPRPQKPYSGIAMIDVMHYFDPNTQESLLQQAFDLLEEGGTLLVREVNPDGGIASSWNRLYEKLATGIGFTQAEKKGLHFRSTQEWKKTMERAGFKVSSERCSSFLFADILYVCERTEKSC
jgi:glycosyltransferase involved in cell wall biosynthesis/trans-aconitate methyltransferase